MKLYKTTAKLELTGHDPDIRVIWHGSQSEASAYRAQAVRDGCKRKDVETETIDIPTNKTDLLNFLNGGGL